MNPVPYPISDFTLTEFKLSMAKDCKILTDAGDRYRLADPSTWPEQAGMANRKEWNALKEYQDYLQGGRTR